VALPVFDPTRGVRPEEISKNPALPLSTSSPRSLYRTLKRRAHTPTVALSYCLRASFGNHVTCIEAVKSLWRVGFSTGTSHDSY